MSAPGLIYAGRALLDQRPEPRPIIRVNDDGSVSVSMPTPGKCAGCGRVAMFFVSRAGVSRCAAECDPKAVRP